MRGINGRKNERLKKEKYRQRKRMKACMKDKGRVPVLGSLCRRPTVAMCKALSRILCKLQNLSGLVVEDFFFFKT